MVRQAAPRRRRQTNRAVEVSDTQVAPVFDVTRLGPYGPITNIANLFLYIMARLRPNWLQLISTSAISIAATLVAAHYLFGTYFVPASYQADREAAQLLQAKVAKIETDFTKLSEEHTAFADKTRTAIKRNKQEIDSVAEQVGEQVDGFWIPLTFDVYQINESQKFILPLSAKHNVRMMITASNTDLDFFEKYLTLYIDDRPLTPIDFFINHDSGTLRLRDLKAATRFDEDQDSQSFELRVRRGLTKTERADFQADLAEAQRPLHGDTPTGQISVLLVVKRPILTTANEENVPPPDGDPNLE